MDRREFIALLGGGMATAMMRSEALGQATASKPATQDRGSRHEENGWIYLHLEGTPHDIGYQHGHLLAKEIDDSIVTLQHQLARERTEWSTMREASQRLFWSRLDPEYQEELSGIAAGLQASGLKYDVNDVLAYNSHIEISMYYLPSLRAKKTGMLISRAPRACSALIATGRHTADGKIVMAHNLWWDYIMGQRWRVLLDIQPANGNRLVMDALPGFIHSGSDFVVNSGGILITETTIGGFFGFDEAGLPEFERARKAAQYSNSLDDFYHIMNTGNNGGYANTWLVGDVKTSEIGKLELGLKNVVFSRSKNGYYIGANFPEDPNLTATECFPGAADDTSCIGRKARWARLIAQNQGKIDAGKAREFLGDTYDETRKSQGASVATLCGREDLDSRTGYGAGGAVNAKVVTSEMAQHMQIWVRMGFPDGSELKVGPYLEKHPGMSAMAPYFHDIVAEPWTLYDADKER